LILKHQLLSVIIGCCLSGTVFAQGSYFQANDREAQHFVGISYGMGSNFWFSKTENYNLFDPRGSMVVSGDSKLRARNISQQVQLETVVPISKKIRVGMGIAFEEFALYKMDVESDILNSTIPFVEVFRFDKVFAQFEMQVGILKQSQVFSFNANVKAGYYGFTSVKSTSLFGEDRIGKTYYGSMGMLVDANIFPRFYLYLLPQVEYKYFNNHRREHPHTISHNLLGYTFMVGLRYHVF
jgi:hypothetical protein